MTSSQNTQNGVTPVSSGALGSRKEAIRDALIDQAESLFREAWGEPEKVGAKDWRAKSGSSRSMVMRGSKRGMWHDHKASIGGDIFDFVAVELCGLTRAADDFPRVIDEAARWCGLSIDAPIDISALIDRKAARDAMAEAEAAKDAVSKAALVEALLAQAEAVTGSPAAAYLATRGITALPHDWYYLPPVSALGVLHPERAALMVPAVDDDGIIRGGQRILILPDGSKAPEQTRKPSFGSIGGFPARISAQVSDGPLIVCEGPETAAAIAQATGFEVWAVFGVSGFKTAPAPTDRKVVFCPDQDAAGSPAANSFAVACLAQVDRGVDLWIAKAPEDEGSKRDLNDTLQRAGAEAVISAINLAYAAEATAPRDGKGRFTGQGVVQHDRVLPPPVFMEPAKARAQIKLTLEGFLEETAQFIEAGEQEALPPVLAIAASAGSGKSTMTRKALAAFDLALFGGDVVFYTPTLALADEAATEFGGHVTRGRSATNPDTGEPMCNRSELAQKVGNAGLNVKATLCEKRLADGTTSLCPHFHSCAYLNQWNVLPDKPVVRFETHNYLTICGDGSGRKPALRVIDESIWRQFTRVVDLQIDQWVRPRNPYVKGESKAAVDHATELAADASQASLDVLRALQNGSGPLSLPYSAEDYSGFAEAEVQPMTLRGDPTDSDDNLFAELARKEMDAAAMKRRRLWLILADCKERELTQTERLRLIVDTPLQGGGKADVIRITWLADLPHDVPVLLLDADATPKITKRIYPNARLESFTLKPNAEVIQLTDKTLSKATVLDRPAVNNSGNRREMAELVRAEVYRDSLTGNRGVLAIATKEIVEAIFKDAGYDIDSMGGNAQRALMMDTPLHGARWLWFGPASLGLNTWEKFGTAIVFGREELPVGVLEDMGLALFGDTDEPVQMVQPNEKGQMLLPRVPLPLHMADGSAAALATTAHPDRRVREIQEQTRERSTGQSIERLRLANAVNRKRVVLASAVPIPNLPVDRLVTWQELRPTRFEAAIAEAAASGSFLRLSAAGLAADAPMTFPTEKAAARWLSREGREQVNTPTPLIRDTINGAGVLTPVLVNIRLEGQRGPRPTPALALTSRAGRDEAVAQFGALSLYEAQTIPAPEPIQSSEVVNAEDIPELRPQIRQMRVNNMISIAPYMRSRRSGLPQGGSIALIAEALHRTKDRNTLAAFARISPSQVQADLDALFVLGLVDRDMNLEGVFAPRKLVMDCSIKGSDLMAAFMAQRRVEVRTYA